MVDFSSWKTVGLAYTVAGYCADLKGWTRTRQRRVVRLVTWNPAREPPCELIT